MSWRKMVIDEATWEYMCGTGNAVIKSPTGIKTVVDYSILTGRSWDTLDDGRRDGSSYGMVKPKHIKAYIVNTIMKNATS